MHDSQILILATIYRIPHYMSEYIHEHFTDVHNLCLTFPAALQSLLLSSFYKWRKWKFRALRLNNMPQVPEPLIGEARVQTQVSLIFTLMPYCVLGCGSIPVNYLGPGALCQLSKTTYFSLPPNISVKNFQIVVSVSLTNI